MITLQKGLRLQQNTANAVNSSGNAFDAVGANVLVTARSDVSALVIVNCRMECSAVLHYRCIQ